MLLDKQCQLSAAQDITASGAVSTNAYDLGDVTPKRQVGTGTPLAIVIVVTTAAAGGGSMADTFVFRAISSAVKELTNPTVLSAVYPAGAGLVAGAVVVIPIPPGTPNQRWLGADYDTGTGDTVSVSSWVIPQDMIQEFLAYAKNYAV